MFEYEVETVVTFTSRVVRQNDDKLGDIVTLEQVALSGEGHVLGAPPAAGDGLDPDQYSDTPICTRHAQIVHNAKHTANNQLVLFSDFLMPAYSIDKYARHFLH